VPGADRVCDRGTVPEGDTIHQAAQRIGVALAGHVVDEVRATHPRSAARDFAPRLQGREVSAVQAHGKHLFICFAGGLTLHSHLRMTGMWGVYRSGQRWSRSPRRAWLVLRHGDVEAVQFDGPVLELMTESRRRADPRLAALGQDVLGERFDAERFLRRLRADAPGRAIGDALLSQGTVAGIGNVWKSELCFAAGIDPWRSVRAVSDGEALELVELARELMRASVRDGHRARPRAVYRRAGMPCVRCGATIRAHGQGVGNRTTYWCPRCQR
jgi:endonuclease VIII